MDILLSKITQQAMSYAIRSGVTITTGYAIRECSRLLKTVKGSERDEIAALQRRLDSKIRIISPAIDMIELIAARGNTSLDSAVTLTKAIRLDIQSLGLRLAQAATDEENLARGSSKAKSQAQNDAQLKSIIADIKALLGRIEDAVPLINLAITTSGVNLSTTLPATVSPSRLLQASTFLTAGDSAYTASPGNAVQVGPAFTLSLYMLFAGHTSRPQDEDSFRETTWKEVLHKARVKLMRVPLDRLSKLPSDSPVTLPEDMGSSTGTPGVDHAPDNIPSEGKAYEFAYQLLVIEDLDDDRVHTFEEDEEQPSTFEGVSLAGIREVIPIHQISKIFYADTGKILNIGADAEANNPILLLKRDINAVAPRQMMDESVQEDEPGLYNLDDEEDDGPAAQLRRESSIHADTQSSSPAPFDKQQQWRFPQGLDPEWIAFEVYVEEPETDDDDDINEPSEAASSPPPRQSHSESADPLSSALANMRLHGSPAPMSPPIINTSQMVPIRITESPAPKYPTARPPALPPLRTSLSLLEILIRLTALQQFQQSSHLSISDELLNFFLSESSTTGAGADSEYRRRVRRDARRRVGFDPYDESPIKLHGEEYQRTRAGQDDHGSHFGGESEYDYVYPAHSPRYTPQPSSRQQSPRYTQRASGSSIGSPFVSSPSPSLRRTVQERTARSNSTPAEKPLRGSGLEFSGTQGSPSVKGRLEQVRRTREPVHNTAGRSGGDSALGTSPRTVDGDRDSEDNVVT